jgi:hypothetical protein
MELAHDDIHGSMFSLYITSVLPLDEWRVPDSRLQHDKVLSECK